MHETIEADIVIIGGGIAGAAIARELSRYDVDTVLIEKEADVGMGVSKTGHGYIYTGLEMSYSMKGKGRMAAKPGSPDYDHIQLVRECYPKADKLLHELDVGHKHRGVLIIARNSEEEKELEIFEEIARDVHALDSSQVKIIDRNTLFEIEPNITKEAVAAVYDPECVIDVFPPEYVIALAENARDNGVRMFFNTEALSISKKNGSHILETNNGAINARFIINAAGKYADRVADMVGARKGWELVFTRHQTLLFDKHLDGLINNHLHDPLTDRVISNISPVHDGNIYVAYNRQRSLVTDRENRATSRESFDLALGKAREMVPALSEKDVIASFVGLTTSKHGESLTYNMEVAKNDPCFINATPKMPALAPSSLVAERIVEHLGTQGLSLGRKDSFSPTREGIPRFRELSEEERDRLIFENPDFGHVICRCETVTEGEIVEAIRRGATTVQGVQFRTRAGMGRCQSGFCGPRLVNMLSRELGIPPTEVTKKGGASRVLHYRSKELLQGV